MNRAAQIIRWSKLATLAALLLAIALGIHLRVEDLDDIGSRSPDERVYTGFARQLAADGWPAMPLIFSAYLHDPAQWDYPPPTRLSTLALVSSVMAFSGAHDERAGAWVACAASILSLILVSIIGWRLFNPETALVAVGLMAFCLTELAGARRSWQDTTLGAITLVSLYVSSAIIRQPQVLARHAGFLVLGVLLLLTKQTGVLVYAICATAIAFALYLQPRRWLRLAQFSAACLGSVAVAVWMLSLAAGGLQKALAALLHSVELGAGAKAYAATFQTASLGEFLTVIFAINPFLFLMEMIGIGVLLRTAIHSGADRCDAAERINAALVAALFLVFVAFVGLYPGAQNFRFFSPATGAGYILAAASACWIIKQAHRKSRRLALAAGAVLILAGAAGLQHEYALYESRIVAGDTQDLCIKWLHG